MAGIRGNNCGAVEQLAFGDGADGQVYLTGTVFLTRDMYYQDLVVPTGTILYTGGFRVHVRDTLTIGGNTNPALAGIIANNGTNARNSNGSLSEVSGAISILPTQGGFVGSTGGGGFGAGGMYNGAAGVGDTQHPASGTSTILVPAPSTASMFPASFGGIGGAGGSAANATGVITGSATGSTGSFTYSIYTGSAGASGSVPLWMGQPHNFFFMISAGLIGGGQIGTGSFNLISGGGGGGAGGCYNSGTVGVQPRSGWGGGGGGITYIAARNLNISGSVQALGGNGGNTFACAGGGGGGGGGVIILLYANLSTQTDLGPTLEVNGGTGGLGQSVPGTTTPAQNGKPGQYFTFEL
ncbi:MAG: hypothetical protein ACYDHY_07505 [Acidiferrobacterales bacterium]